MCDTIVTEMKKTVCACTYHTYRNERTRSPLRTSVFRVSSFYKLKLLLPPQAAALHTSDEELAENQISTWQLLPCVFKL